MKPLFISKEILIKRAYRQDKGFRLAGALIVLALAAQVPVAFIAFRNTRGKNDLEFKARVLQSEFIKASDERRKLGVLENQLSELKAWDPILRRRFPTSALLANIEQAIPPEVVLSSLRLASTLHSIVKLKGGAYDMPSAYRLTIEGQQRGTDPDPTTRFSQAILAKTPPGSKVLLNKLNEADVKGVCQFELVFDLPANGNYYNLGITKIQQPEGL